jgi:hypothetical protein
MAPSHKRTAKTTANARLVPFLIVFTNPWTLLSLSLAAAVVVLALLNNDVVQRDVANPEPQTRRTSETTTTTMAWFQKQFTLPARARGSYLITDTVVSQLPEIRNYKIGLLNLFIQHTSCALSLNENVRRLLRPGNVFF